MKIFDSHFHIIDPQYPLVLNHGYSPPKFTVHEYLKSVETLNVKGGALVSGSFQQFDQSYLEDSLNKLGKNYVGVANIPVNIIQQELERLNEANVTGVRFNLKRGSSEQLKHMVYLSNQLYDEYNWHTEVYIDSKNLKDLKSILVQIPKFSIDHLGLSKAGLEEVYYWAEKGMKIKATGFGRIDFDPIAIMDQIYSINPGALLFGTDLPSTRSKKPFTNKDVELIKDHFGEIECQKIFYDNAIQWYMN